MRAKVDFVIRDGDGTLTFLITVADRYRVAARGFHSAGHEPHWEIDDMAKVKAISTDTSHGQMIINSAREAIDHFDRLLKAKGVNR